MSELFHTHTRTERERDSENHHFVRKLCQETWQAGEIRHLKKAGRQRRDRGGRSSKSTDLLFSLSALTDCNFSTCQQQLTRMLCVYVYVGVCVFWRFFFVFSLPRQHRYSWLSRIASLWGIKRTQTFSLRHSHSFSRTHTHKNTHTHTHKAGIPPDVTLAPLAL